MSTMAKLWSSRSRSSQGSQWPASIIDSLGAADNGTQPALGPGMPAHQHLGSAHSNRGISAGGAGRELDGVPHDVVGLSALFSVLFAAVILGMWLSGSTGRVAAVAMCMVGVPMLVSGLRKRSEREREGR